MTEQKAGFCVACDTTQAIERKTLNTPFHIVMTLVTCGAWAFVYLLLSLTPRPWYCVRCGGTQIASGRARPSPRPPVPPAPPEPDPRRS